MTNPAADLADLISDVAARWARIAAEERARFERLAAEVKAGGIGYPFGSSSVDYDLSNAIRYDVPRWLRTAERANGTPAAAIRDSIATILSDYARACKAHAEWHDLYTAAARARAAAAGGEYGDPEAWLDDPRPWDDG